jgi:uncharacterized membrane protein
MASAERIRNPIEWTVDMLQAAGAAARRAGLSLGEGEAGRGSGASANVNRITIADLKDVLQRGLADFGSYRTDVIFLCVIYPLAGLLLWRLAFGYELLPMVFPLASGFALLGPVAALGLYEMSRRREQGMAIGWLDAFRVLRAPAIGAIIALGLALLVVFLIWLATAYVIYLITLGPAAPASVGAFLRDVFLTPAGWVMIVVGVGTGFLFAAFVLAISVVSFPMLLDREVTLASAVATSVRAVLANREPMAAWGLIVALGLVLGSLPALLGLIFVMPVLGHATWHLYRKLVPR